MKMKAAGKEPSAPSKKVKTFLFPSPSASPSPPAPEPEERAITYGPASYPWKRNSCWLDTALELMYITCGRNWDEFGRLVGTLNRGSGTRKVLELIGARRKLLDNTSVKDISSQLSRHRDDLRSHLAEKKIIRSEASFESVFVSDYFNIQSSKDLPPLQGWFWELMKHDMDQSSQRFLGYAFFQALTVDIDTCTRGPETGGKHLRLSRTLTLGKPLRRTFHGEDPHPARSLPPRARFRMSSAFRSVPA